MLWTDDRRPVRMDMKLRWPSAVACICLLLSASAAQPPAASTPARTSSTTNATNTPPASSTGRLVGSSTTRANSSASGPGARNATATLAAPSSTAGPVLLTSQSPSKNSTLKSSTTVTSLPRPSSTRRTTVAGDKSWDAAFIYDYESLRHAGLAIAGVLFIMGILVISCGSKACRVRSCRVSKGKSYQVSRD